MDVLAERCARARALRVLIGAMAEKPADVSVPVIRHTEPIRNRRVLPALGERVVVMDRHTGRPRRLGLHAVHDRRGGVPRLGANRRPLPPAVVEFRVDGLWYPWYQLERVTT